MDQRARRVVFGADSAGPVANGPPRSFLIAHDFWLAAPESGAHEGSCFMFLLFRPGAALNVNNRNACPRHASPKGFLNPKALI